jgi:3-methyladenine DNA glycosylase AlkD
MTQAEILIAQLKTLANPQNVAGMARFGINPNNTLGIRVQTLRQIAKGIHDHALAQALWKSGIHEARLLAALVDISREVTEDQMEEWALDFDSWDVCDLVCMHLFGLTSFADLKARQWSTRSEEFVKRAGFVLMVVRAVHDKKAGDTSFIEYLKIIQRSAEDDRNFVKKAVNWALRQIGKRNLALNQAAIQTAQSINSIDSKTARWVASNALNELTSESIQTRLRRSKRDAK